MRFIVFLTILTFASCTYYTRSKPFDINAGSRLNGSPLKLYKTITSDGYIMTIFRWIGDSNAQNLNNKTTNRPAVLLMHGLMSSGVDFAFGIQQSLLASLFGSGYDVFIGNMRGSPFGLEHLTLNADTDPAFWNFSFDEVGTKDLPAIVDKVLEVSGQAKISYVGHMEGTMVFYMLLAQLPDYVNKFDRMVSLGPMAFMKNSPNRVLRKIIDNHSSQQWLLKNLGTNRFLPSDELLEDLENDCQNSGSKYKDTICDNYYFLIKGYDSKSLNTTTVNWVALNVPNGGSVNQFLHLAQTAESGRFQTYSTSWTGIVETQEYELIKVYVPIAVFYTPNDTFSNVEDVVTFMENIPYFGRGINFDRLTNSIDFLYSEDVASNVYWQVVTFLKESVTAYDPKTRKIKRPIPRNGL